MTADSGEESSRYRVFRLLTRVLMKRATIFIIAVNHGDWSLFHNYYGELYSMTWIMAYPLIIIGSRMLWEKTKLKTSIHNSLKKLFPQLTPKKP